ncbi:DUF3397 domain-containing protein [Paenibacillus sp. D2_2]|uniref:DUF3397 domain-containing protein n=1 Tax=Paenibacillus sp. D2_2 TaxID=3073092 RepID=UPI0028158345|nr:DUF3397 domain-containing protein [Paenibacillus sp. D2_2]WMT42428.1 DUF3397 domain-containing protein [Paenibacillus sp. D2_2]
MNVLLGPVFIFTIMPIIPFFLVYFVCVFLKKERKASLLLAMDVTTFFLILSVSVLFNNVFNSKFGFYLILLILLIVVGLIGGAQNRLKGKVDVNRMLRAVWRLAFAGAGIVYIVLFLISFFTYISAI